MVDTEADLDTDSDEESIEHSGGQEEALLQEIPVEEERNIRRSGWQRQPLLRLIYEHTITNDEDDDVTDIFVAHEPSNYEDAIMDDDFDKWKEAMHEEVQALHDHKTWTLVDPGIVRQKLIDGRWVLQSETGNASHDVIT